MALLLVFTCFEMLCGGWRLLKVVVVVFSWWCENNVSDGGAVGCSLFMVAAHSFPYFLA